MNPVDTQKSYCNKKNNNLTIILRNNILVDKAICMSIVTARQPYIKIYFMHGAFRQNPVQHQLFNHFEPRLLHNGSLTSL